MPNSSQDPKQQYALVEELLTRWLRERREVLGKYTEIAVGVDGLLDERGVKQRQAELCQLLVDYVSAGHFEVFHELLAEAESFADGSSALAGRVMPAIADTTELIIAYDEKYGDGASDAKLKRDLSSLGEALENRFTLEDQLIAGLHYSHRRQLS
jgi:regulator of sigma D